MSTPVETPDTDETCAYCRSRIFDHDPICVRDCTDGCGSPTYFCHPSDSTSPRRGRYSSSSTGAPRALVVTLRIPCLAFCLEA
jgi:hypothetical protein